MRITKYKIEIDACNKNVLVKENSNNYSVDSLNSPRKIVEMICNLYRLNHMAEEYCYMICMNSKSKPCGVFEVSHGVINGTFCNSREIFVRCLLVATSQIVILHNHPSGDITPSEQDIKSYRKLKEAGQIMGVEVVDSIIVGGNDFLSIRNFEEA